MFVVLASAKSVVAHLQPVSQKQRAASAQPHAAQLKVRSIPSLSIQTLTPATDESERYARERFGQQKGIGSDEFFGRASYDPTAQQEAKGRLQGFEGATSISSNAYFGRPEEEAPEGDYGDLETAAKDFVRKFGITAGDDLENLTGLLGEGANKLQGKFRTSLENDLQC